MRELQRQLKAQGVALQNEADESTTGPASFIAVDPDGNLYAAEGPASRPVAGGGLTKYLKR